MRYLIRLLLVIAESALAGHPRQQAPATQVRKGRTAKGSVLSYSLQFMLVQLLVPDTNRLRIIDHLLLKV